MVKKKEKKVKKVKKVEKVAKVKKVTKAGKPEVTLEILLKAGCHFGHQSRRWHPKMKPYLYDVRQGVHIFDLVKTKKNLEEALDFVRDVTTKGGIVLLVGTKRQARAIVAEEAKKAGLPYINSRWLGGFLTNWEKINKNIRKLVENKEAREKGEFKKYTKKEQLLIDRDINRLEKFYGGLVALEKVPEAIFVVDAKKEEVAVKEAKKKGIAVVGMIDSNSNPDLVDWIIPSNDDAVAAIKLIVSLVAEAASEGKSLAAKRGKEEEEKIKKEN